MSAPSIIFVHGWCNNYKGWMPLARQLKKDFQLYLIDLPGFGDSGDLKQYSVSSMSDYLSEFVRYMKLKPITIVGLSMGSLIVADMALNYPDLTESVVLAGPVLKDGRKNQLITKAIYYSYRFIDRSSKLESLLKKLVERKLSGYAMAKYINMHQFNKRLVDLYGTQGRIKMRPHAYVQMGKSTALYDLKDTIKKINIPILLLFGATDKVSSADSALKYFGSDTKKIIIEKIKNAGHVVPLEKPKESAQAIKTFLSKTKLA